MKVHEYQAKQLLAQYGVPAPEGRVSRDPSEAERVARDLGCPAAVKAQIHAGGRGRAGGIRTAATPPEAAQISKALLGSRLVTHQTGPEGLPVDTVLVEKALRPEKELYVSLLLDTTEGTPVMVASEAGGMEIEEIAGTTPEKILKQKIDPVTALLPYQARNLGYGMNLPHDQVRAMSKVLSGVYQLFMDNDCSLVEINPLIVTAEGELLALDAKVNFDDNGLARHPEIAELRDRSQEDPLEVQATDLGVNYIKLDGSIGCMVNGAGLAMATMDLVKWAGGEPANFLDVGGGASEDQVSSALKILLCDPKVKAAWVNIFGGILRCDLVARAIVRTLREQELKVPFIVRMNGTNLEEGMRLLAESGLNIEFESGLSEAAQKAVAAAASAGGQV
jgi:succinyl-CoA synthetase beta subunit